jgi:glycerol-3-phosphate dehydrogenase
MIVVIGGGVVGLAAAYAAARRGKPVCVIERHRKFGQETSTHNSGVIHAGLYYPAGTLKATLCIEGRDRLYAFAVEAGVPHAKVGKLIVAQQGEDAALDRLIASAAANGAPLHDVDRRFVADREPHVRAHRAAWSPETGWIEAEALVRALADRVVQHDGALLAGTPIVGVEARQAGGFVVVTPRERIDAEFVVNAAGLQADDVSAMCGGERFQIFPCRGEYAELAPRARHLVRGLVYPVPHASGHGLGVHLTKTLGGAVWIGPTIRYQDSKVDYENGRLPTAAFLEPTRALIPDVTIDDLQLGGSGIRAKLHPPTASFADFMVRADRQNPRLIHAAGIDSPGLTSSLAIGERVADLIA